MLDTIYVNQQDTNQFLEWIKVLAPLIVGIVAACIPYLTEKGRIRKQVSVQKEIDDLTAFSKAFSDCYHTIVGNKLYDFDDNNTEIDPIKLQDSDIKEKIKYFEELNIKKQNQITRARINLAKAYDCYSLYFSQKESEQIKQFELDCVGYAFKLVEYVELRFRQRSHELVIKSTDDPEQKRKFQEKLDEINCRYIFNDDENDADLYKEFEQNFYDILKIIKDKIDKG